MAFGNGVKAMTVTIFMSFFLIITGLLYFMFTLWIVKIGAKFILPELWNAGKIDPSFMLLAAALIAAGSMIASGLQRR